MDSNDFERTRSPLSRFLVEVISGSLIFLVIAAAAVALSYLVSYMKETGVGSVIINGLVAVKYVLFSVDVILFGRFLWVASKRVWREGVSITDIKSNRIFRDASNQAKNSDSDTSELAISQILLAKNKKCRVRSIWFLAISMVIYFPLAYYILFINRISDSTIQETTYSGSIGGFLILVPLVFIIILLINEGIFSYRMKKGFYGNNGYEARQIISFILDNADKIDFNDGSGGKRKVFSDPERTPSFLHGIPTDARGVS